MLEKWTFAFFIGAILLYILYSFNRFILTSDIPISFTFGEEVFTYCLFSVIVFVLLLGMLSTNNKRIHTSYSILIGFMVLFNVATIGQAMQGEYATGAFYRLYIVPILILLIMLLTRLIIVRKK